MRIGFTRNDITFTAATPFYRLVVLKCQEFPITTTVIHPMQPSSPLTPLLAPFITLKAPSKALSFHRNCFFSLRRVFLIFSLSLSAFSFQSNVFLPPFHSFSNHPHFVFSLEATKRKKTTAVGEGRRVGKTARETSMKWNGESQSSMNGTTTMS